MPLYVDLSQIVFRKSEAILFPRQLYSRDCSSSAISELFRA